MVNYKTGKNWKKFIKCVRFCELWLEHSCNKNKLEHNYFKNKFTLHWDFF